MTGGLRRGCRPTDQFGSRIRLGASSHVLEVMTDDAAELIQMFVVVRRRSTKPEPQKPKEEERIPRPLRTLIGAVACPG